MTIDDAIAHLKTIIASVSSEAVIRDKRVSDEEARTSVYAPASRRLRFHSLRAAVPTPASPRAGPLRNGPRDQARSQGLVDLRVEALAFAFTDYALARQANFFDPVETEALAAGVITPDELHRWHESLERASAEGVFFGTGSGVLIAGQKP